MPKRKNPKLVAKQAASMFLSGVGKKAKASSKEIRQAKKIISESVVRAFQETGLDINREQDWTFLAISLATAVYAGRRPGAPTKWSQRRQLKLVADVDRIRANTREQLSDKQACELLAQLPPYNARFGERLRSRSAGSLRRILPQARRLKSALSGVSAANDVPMRQTMQRG